MTRSRSRAWIGALLGGGRRLLEAAERDVVVERPLQLQHQGHAGPGQAPEEGLVEPSTRSTGWVMEPPS